MVLWLSMVVTSMVLLGHGSDMVARTMTVFQWLVETMTRMVPLLP